MLNDLLTKAGYEVVASDNGEDAIVKAKTGEARPDPHGRRHAGSERLPGDARDQPRSGDASTIPVIMCTSKSQETDKIWGMRQGARDYVVKPVDRDELLAKISSLG